MFAFAPLDAATGGAYHAVSSLVTALTPVAGPAAAAVAIVVFTVAVRLLIAPLTWLQVRGERRRAALSPRIAVLRERHGDDPARLGAELTALYRAEGASPVGCLPVLAQWPFFLVMYRLFTTATIAGAANPLLAERLAGVPLGARFLDVGTSGLAVYAVLLVWLLAVAWWLSRRSRRTLALAADPSAGPAALTRLLPLLPYATVVVAVVLPLAAGLYLATSASCTALEHAVLRRPAPGAR